MPEDMRQYAPYPTVLAELVAHLRYRPGWIFDLKDIQRDDPDTHGSAAGGLTFIGVTGTVGYDSEAPDGHKRVYEGAMDAYHPGVERPVHFYFPVPAATYNEASWKRWLFDRILEVERHEAMEHFHLHYEGDFVNRSGKLVDHVDVRPFAPAHGPGDDPYVIHEYADDVKRRTSFRGVVSADAP